MSNSCRPTRALSSVSASRFLVRDRFWLLERCRPPASFLDWRLLDRAGCFLSAGAAALDLREAERPLVVVVLLPADRDLGRGFTGTPTPLTAGLASVL